MSADDSSFGPAVCRVCLCGESSIPYMGTTGGEPLISPCHCKGSMGLYHKSCLEHWLYTSRTTHCEICNFRFQYGTKNQTICAYFRLRGWNDKGMRSLPGDLFSISTFTPVAALMIYLCIKSSHENLTNSPESGVTGEIFVMLALAFIIASVIFFWYILTLCFHYQQFRLWQAHHKLVFIIDQLEYSRRSEKGSFMSKLVSMFCCCVHDENSRHHVPLSDVNINPNMISPGGSLHASDSPGSSSSSSSNSPLINNSRGHVETTRSSTGFPLATFRPNGAAPDCISSLPLLYRDEPRIYDVPPDATNFSDIDLGTPLQTSPRPTGTPPLFPSPLLTLTETFV